MKQAEPRVLGIEYRHVECEADQVQDVLDVHAEQGWAVQLLSPFTIRGGQGIDSVRYSVLLGRQVVAAPAEPIAMRG